jgi:hypothetical protein
MRVAHLTKMRQHGIIFGILLLLSIIDFALAAPIPVQEDLQPRVDVPRDVVNVVEKRADDELIEKLSAYFEKWANPPASSSSLAPQPGPEHESTSDRQTSSSPPPEPEHGSTGDAQAPSSPPLGPEHELTSDAQTSSSPPPGLEHESTSDAQAPSSPPPGPEHGPMNDEQASGPAPEPAPSTANPLVEPSNPLSIEPPTYTPASTVPSSYASADYGSDDESAGTHVSSYPSEWDHWLNPQNHPDQEDHMSQPDSPPPQEQEQEQEQQQQNGFAHGDDVQQPHQNGFAHGQMDDVASAGSTDSGSYEVSSGTPSEFDATIAAYEEWLNRDDAGRQDFHMHPQDPLTPPQQDELAHGAQMGDVQQQPLPQEHDVGHGSQVDDVAATGPSGHTPAPTLYDWESGVPGIPEPQTDSPLPEYHWTQVDDVQQPPPSNENGVAHGIQMDNVVPTNFASHSQDSSGYGLDYGSQGTHGSQPDSTPAEWDFWLNPHDSAYHNLHIHQPNPPLQPQVDDVAHGTHLDDVQQPPQPSQEDVVVHGTQVPVDDVQPPQENGVAHETQDNVHQPPLPQGNDVARGTQVDDGQQPNPEPLI